jgi:hypothetical protein
MLPIATNIICAALNALLSAYFLCQVVELSLAVRITLNRPHAGRTVATLTRQFFSLIAITLFGSLALIELRIPLPRDEITDTILPFASAGLGIGIVLLSLVFSSRFREQVSTDAERRLAPFRNSISFSHRRFQAE